MELDPNEITPRRVMRELFTRRQRVGLFFKDILFEQFTPGGWPSSLEATRVMEDADSQITKTSEIIDITLPNDTIIPGL